MAKLYLMSSCDEKGILNHLTEELREAGHQVEAFCDKSDGRFSFNFERFPNVDWADALLLVESRKRFDLEAGYAKGKDKFLIIYQEERSKREPDILHDFADSITNDINEVIEFLAAKKMIIS